MERIDKRKLIGVLLVIALTAVIALEIGRALPTIGALDTPANGEISDYYINHAEAETASPNLVTAVLADYRGFDTLFETCVLFLSGVIVCMTLMPAQRQKKPEKEKTIRDLRSPYKTYSDIAYRCIIPVLVIYAIYVLLHGEVSLGGGFQAGALLACAYLLDRISPGDSMYLPRLKPQVTLLIGAAGTLLYAATGILCILGGGNFLEYTSLPFAHAAAAKLHGTGIFMIETGVTVCVMAVIIQILEIVLERTGFDD